jgi:hypothetical protein
MGMEFHRIALLSLTVLSLGCGGSAGVVSSLPPTEPLVLMSFNNPVPAGSTGFTANAVGGGFTANTTLFWNGSPLPTSYQTNQILSATVSAQLLSVPGNVVIVAKDSATGKTSNSIVYAVLSPGAATAGVVRLISGAPDGSPANGDSLIQASISQTGRFVAFQSAGTNLVSEAVIAPWANIYLTDTCIGAPVQCVQSTQLISISADKTTGGNQHSRVSAVSQGGRYVTFDSGATNLVANTPSYCSSGSTCIYLRDTCTGVSSVCTPSTSLVSILPGEVGYGGADPAISPSGRYLAFDSNGPPANQPETYLRDMCINAAVGCVPNTIAISTNSSGGFGNEGAGPESLTPSGTFVGFVSYSTNLIDPSQPANQSTAMMFVRNTCIGAGPGCIVGTARVDVPNNGGLPNGQLDYEATPSFSVDGRYIAYSSHATNLVPQNVNGFGNVYVRDTCANVITCVPQTQLVSLGNDGSVGNSGSHQQTMSADGRYVAFTSIATNLVWGIPYPAGSWQDVYVRDTCMGASGICYPSTVRVAVTTSPYIQTPSNAGASWAVISADGHYAAFLSSSSNLTSSGSGGHQQVFLAKTGF